MTIYYRFFQTFDKPIIILKMENGLPKVADANEAFQRLFGYTLEELQAKNSLRLLETYRIDLSKQVLKSEYTLHTKQRKPIQVRIHHTPLPSPAGCPDMFSYVELEDLTAYKWIERKVQEHKVVISGIVDQFSHIRFLRDSVAALMLEPDRTLEDETLLSFIADYDHERLVSAMAEAGAQQQEQSITLQTSRLNGMELELSITFMPIYDGFGEIMEYAFVIWDLKPVDQSIDSATKLKIWMAKRDMTAGMLSDATGISIQTISKLRNGKIVRPQRLTAELIASELRVAVHEIWSKVGK